MSNTVSINRKKVLGGYLDARNEELIPDGAHVCAGVILSLALPQIVLYVYGGQLLMIAFASGALGGSAWGLARYFWFPLRLPTFVGAGPAARVPPREELRQNVAA